MWIFVSINHLFFFLNQISSMTRFIWSGNFTLGSLDHPEEVCGSKLSRFILREWGAIRNFPVMVKVSWLDIYCSERFWWRWSRYCRIFFQTALATSAAVIQQWLHWQAVINGDTAWEQEDLQCWCLRTVGHVVLSQRTAAEGYESGGASQKLFF